MQIYPTMSPLDLGDKQGSAVALGYFDGIHLGHRAVIGGAVDWARAHGAAPAVFTFQLPAGSRMKGRRLLSTEDKHRIIAGLGVEHYLVPAFEDIQAMTPEQFVRGLVTDCRARALFCGENFTFGAKAAGDPGLLRQLCAPLGVEVYVQPMAQFEGKPVSSSRIRSALEGGDIPAANAMLGAPYAIIRISIMGQGWAAPWVCPPSTRSIPQATSCPGTASTSPAPPSEGPAILRPPVWAPGPPSTTIPPRSPARPSSPVSRAICTARTRWWSSLPT